MKKHLVALACLSAFAGAHAPFSYAAEKIEQAYDGATGSYIALRIGGSFLDDSRFELNAAPAIPTHVSNAYDDTSFFGAAAAGISFNGSFRGEVELGYIQHEIEAHTLTTVPAVFAGASASGDTNVFTGLINGYYDFQLAGLAPYVSAGIGVGHVSFDGHGVTVPAGGLAGLPAGPFNVIDDDATGLAWQVGAGTSFDVYENLSFEIGYRYQAINYLSLTAADGSKSGSDLTNHQILFGVRRAF